jgi:methionine-rich copper-binding protein CopC
MRWAATLACGMLATAAAVGVVAAHAFLDRASPGVGGTVRGHPPERVSIWYTEPLEPVFSRIQVLDGAGRRVDRGDGAVDAHDPRLLTTSLQPLGPGTYTVVWRVVSVDTHATSGDYTFTVAP